MASSKIVTGQYVTLSQQPASVGDRVVARLIDYAVLAAYAIVAYLIITRLIDSDIMSENALAFVAMGLFLPALLYHPLMELLHHGQSIGKTVMKIRVVNRDGTSPTLSAYLLRFILTPVDIEFSGLGVVAIVLSRDAQRLGDMAAGTMVIKLHRQAVQLPDYTYTMEGYTPTYSEAGDLSLNQAELIAHVLNYTRPNRPELVHRLAEKVAERLGAEARPDDELFLYTVLNDYSYYCSTIEA